MVFRATAMRAQRADCHDNCDGKGKVSSLIIKDLGLN
jgi:predicted mannosyl-3-phosphoglycerate phosphatase (HAD superfamily)